jgi:transglutaminase/protease-like cytokinesis protein 3
LEIEVCILLAKKALSSPPQKKHRPPIIITIVLQTKIKIMTKYLPILLALLFSFPLLAQEEESTVSAVAMPDKNEAPYDKEAIGNGFIEPEALAEILTANAKTDREKAEAIYHWVTHHIAYDLKQYEEFRAGDRDKKGGNRIPKKEMEEHDAKKVKRALQSRSGICEDYALIVNSLCVAAGLESKVVDGYIRIDPEKIRSTGEKHVWNLVKIEGEWQPLDATYGAGYINQYNEFKFDYDPNYFLSPKEAFSFNHLPKDSTFMLTDTIMLRDQFKNFPIIGRGFFDFSISNYAPMQVMQEVTQGEELLVTFTSPKKIGQFTIYKEKADEYEFVKKVKDGDNYTVHIHTKDLKTGRIMLFGDKQLIAAYRLVVKKGR